MRHSQPAMFAVTVLLLAAFTAWSTPGDLVQQSITASNAVDDSSSESKALQLAEDLQRVEPQGPKIVDSETIWLARAIYSETKQPHEQELVAWVVRNRVETNFRGNSSYQEAVLDPYQFSAFNPENSKRTHYISLEKSSNAPGWQQAIEIAKKVQHSPYYQRPFAANIRHFYSERSMVGRHQPYWAEGHRHQVSINNEHQIDERRFRFYADVS